MKAIKKPFFLIVIPFSVVVFIHMILFPYATSKYWEPEQFEIVNGVPYCVKDGVLYCYEDDNWSAVNRSEQTRQLVGSGLALCTVDMSGKVSCDGDLTVSQSMSLTAAHYCNMARSLIELSESTPITELSDDVIQAPSALSTDGAILLPVVDHYERYIMEEKPIALSDEFVLTDKGNVYRLQVINFDEPYLRCIYDGGDITSISAYSTGQCLGVTEAGTVHSWNESGYKNFNIPSVLDWAEVSIVKQGFHFAVGLTKKGEVLYADNNEENTNRIGNQLKAWGKIKNIAIYGMTVYGLKSDGSCLSFEIDL